MTWNEGGFVAAGGVGQRSGENTVSQRIDLIPGAIGSPCAVFRAERKFLLHLAHSILGIAAVQGWTISPQFKN